MTTLAKGLAVMRSFNEKRPRMTLSEAAAAAEISRATARRILRTLAELGYVEQNGRHFSLAPRMLELGFGYLATQSWVDRAMQPLTELSEAVQDPCSAAILQDTDIVYVARVTTTERIMSVSVSVGSHLPAFHTALGRAQLGFLDDDELWRRLKSMQIRPFTSSTITDLKALFDRIRDDRRQGFSIVDEELERGLRAIAVPIVDRAGRAIAAINISTNSTRTTRNHMREKFLPRLRAAADHISQSLTA